jgi:hypothetical protein
MVKVLVVNYNTELRKYLRSFGQNRIISRPFACRNSAFESGSIERFDAVSIAADLPDDGCV